MFGLPYSYLLMLSGPAEAQSQRCAFHQAMGYCDVHLNPCLSGYDYIQLHGVVPIAWVICILKPDIYLKNVIGISMLHILMFRY